MEKCLRNVCDPECLWSCLVLPLASGTETTQCRVILPVYTHLLLYCSFCAPAHYLLWFSVSLDFACSCIRIPCEVCLCIAKVGGIRCSCLPQHEPPQWVGEAVDSPGSVPPLDAGSIHLPEIFSSLLQSSTAPLTAAPLLRRIYILCLVRLICALSPSLSFSLSHSLSFLPLHLINNSAQKQK